VEPSPWPLAASIALLTTTCQWWFIINIRFNLWFRDTIIQGTFQESHTSKVQQGLTLGFILFVVAQSLKYSSLFLFSGLSYIQL
jgi:hypothetical protein